LYPSPNIIRVIKSRRMRWMSYAACTGAIRQAEKIFNGKTEGKRPLGTPRGTREDNIRIDIRYIGWEGVDLSHMVQDRYQWRALVNAVMNLWVP
jgi:hypothetical protein